MALMLSLALRACGHATSEAAQNPPLYWGLAQCDVAATLRAPCFRRSRHRVPPPAPPAAAAAPPRRCVCTQ